MMGQLGIMIVYASPIDTRVNNPILVDANITRSCYPVDRTGVGNYLEYDCPMIPHDTTLLTFEECMMQRAEELWAYDKPIVLFWSGGLDSTAIYYALRETQQSELTIRCNHHSVQEHPELFRTFDNPDLVENLDLCDPKLFENDAILKVTGDCGDQLFGCKTAQGLVGDMPWLDQWQSFMSERARDFWLLQTGEAPFDIHTVIDLMWWANFTMEYAPYDFTMTCVYGNTFAYETTLAYFCSDEFQKWSITNHDLKYAGWKMPMRDFVYKYSGDKEYSYQKQKRSSLVGGIINANKFSMNAPLLIDSSGNKWKRSDDL